MLSTLKRLSVSFLIALLVLNITSLPMMQPRMSQVEASTITTGKVTSSILNIRASKSTSAKRVKLLHKGDSVNLLTTDSKWVKVEVNGVTGYTQGAYIATEYGTASDTKANIISGTVNSKVLNIRESKSENSTALAVLKKGAKVRILTTDSKWVQVKVDDVIGYTQGKYITTSNGGTASNPTTKGESVIDYALQFVGNPYRWGGTSLTNGCDCSGYVMSVYRHFGKSLPHSSYSLRSVGSRVSGLSNAKPGDIICYSGHVALYMGNNKIVHASNPKDGIKISSNASYRHIVAIRRIFK